MVADIRSGAWDVVSMWPALMVAWAVHVFQKRGCKMKKVIFSTLAAMVMVLGLGGAAYAQEDVDTTLGEGGVGTAGASGSTTSTTSTTSTD
jgi:hypothetical protein